MVSIGKYNAIDLLQYPIIRKRKDNIIISYLIGNLSKSDEHGKIYNALILRKEENNSEGCIKSTRWAQKGFFYPTSYICKLFLSHKVSVNILYISYRHDVKFWTFLARELPCFLGLINIIFE